MHPSIKDTLLPCTFLVCTALVWFAPLLDCVGDTMTPEGAEVISGETVGRDVVG